MLVLEIGPNIKPQAQILWPEAEIKTLDIDENLKPDYVADAGKMPEELYEKFDAVLASHVLEHFPYWYSVLILKEWAKVLKPGGSLHVVVPSLEWVGKEILAEKPSKALLPHLFGGLTTPYDCHVAGYTMRYLRACFEAAELGVTKAASGDYCIMVQGTPYTAEQHYVCGVKNDNISRGDA
ncbi:MAG: methyltransferase domain-containing protein [Dehalococcoidia bacterium]|jgi:SAM-dependent methyltransferase